MTKNKFSITTLNCKGLNDTKKRNNIFNIFKQYHSDIYFFQETNLSTSMTSTLQQLWPYQIHSTYYTAIFINNSNYIETDYASSYGGRVQKLDFSLDSVAYRIYNVYAPPSLPDRVHFWNSFSPTLKNNAHNIILGDFNSILYPDKERFSLAPLRHDPTRNIILNSLSSYTDVIDTTSSLPVFTFEMSTSAGTHRSRLDYIFSDRVDSLETSNTFYAFSDHLALRTVFNQRQASSGTNHIWKLNSRTLRDPSLQDKILNNDQGELSDWDEQKFLWRNLLLLHKSKLRNSYGKLDSLTKEIAELTSLLRKHPTAMDIPILISNKQAERSKLSLQCAEAWRLRSNVVFRNLLV